MLILSIQNQRESHIEIFLCCFYQYQIVVMSLWDRVKEELQIERERYTRTKYGKIIAFLLYVGMFKTGPWLLNTFMPYMQNMESYEIFAIILLSNMIVVSGLFNLSIYIISKYKFFQQYRINPDKPFPWEQTDRKKIAEWRRIITYNLTHAGIKYLIILPALIVVIGKHFNPPKYVLDMSLCPTWYEMIPQMLIMMVVEDILNYLVHRAFHHPKLYSFHKEHHEYKYSIPLTAWHFHYWEFLFLQIIPGQIYLEIAKLYAPVHIGTMSVWFIFRMWNNNSTHCGYVFPWVPTSLLPFALNDEFHDFHHTHNEGNFGLYFRLCDVFFGTTKAFREFKAKQKAVKDAAAAITPKSD